MVEADGRNAATVEHLFSRLPPAAGGPARRGGRALGADGDGVAAVGLVEALRVGSAMPCPQGVMSDAVAPKRWLLRPPPCGGDGMRGGRRALRPSGWWRRSGSATRCRVHKEWLATPSVCLYPLFPDPKRT